MAYKKYLFRSTSKRAIRADLLRKLNESKRETEADKDVLEKKHPAVDLTGLLAMGEAGLAVLKAASPQFKKRMETLIEQREKRAEQLRWLQWSHDVMRPAKNPDLLDVALAAMGMTLVEGALAAGTMAADGKLDVAQAITYGGLFASVNVAVGLCGGFFGLRYMFYKLRSPMPEVGDGKRRIAGSDGFITSIAGLALLMFTGARTRATGSHKNIFSFDEIGFWATFNDSFAILLIAIGGVSSLLALWKGFSAILDPCPELTEARRNAEDGINQQVEKAAADVEAQCVSCAESFIDEAKKALFDFDSAENNKISNHSAHSDAVREHNNKVEEYKLALTTVHADGQEARSWITRKPSENADALALNDFDALKMNLIGKEALEVDSGLLQQITRLRELLHEVRAAQDTALASIHEAEGDYHASAPNLDLLPDFTS